MTQDGAALQRAIQLMREALVLLDAEGAAHAAFRLQWAIDLAEAASSLPQSNACPLGPLSDGP